MTTLNEAKRVLYRRVISTWLPQVSFSSTTQLTFGPESFKPPANQPWCRVTLSELFRSQVTLNGPGHRQFSSEATLVGQIFGVPGTTSESDMDSYADTFRKTFEGVSLSSDDIYIFGGTILPFGIIDNWIQTNVQISMIFRERR